VAKQIKRQAARHPAGAERRARRRVDARSEHV